MKYETSKVTVKTWKTNRVLLKHFMYNTLIHPFTQNEFSVTYLSPELNWEYRDSKRERKSAHRK